MISLRQIPPISISSPSDQVFFAALTDGPRVLAFPVMRAHADVVVAAAVASAADMPLDKSQLTEPANVAILDAHAMVYAMKPSGFLVEFQHGAVRPHMITGSEEQGEFIPVSPSMMALISSVWSIPIVAVEDDFRESAAEVPAAEDAVPWTRAEFSKVFSKIISTKFQGIEFDTDVPEHLAVRLGLLEGEKP